MPRKPKQIPETVQTEEQARALAAVGLTIAEIADVLKVSEYDVNRGALSQAYKEGRANGKKSILAAQYRRALNDSHPGCVYAADKMLKMVHGLHETQGIAVGDSNITLLLTPEPPSNGTTA
jgi:hypothetical protein